jgi:2-polyprenyl-3-methyl-5-hydroxy-6-metoxy-1,4-benzoquinol methylase
LSIQNDNGAHTNVEFWDAQWNQRSSYGGIASKLRSADFGENGAFLRVLNQHAPGLFANARLVELGGASSRFAIDLAKYAQCDVTIVDNSEVGIEISKKLFSQENVEINTVYGNIFDLSKLDGGFDVVTHWGLMEHFEDPRSIFDISSRLLKPGGHVVYSMPNMAAVGARLWKRHAPANFSAHIFHTDEALNRAAIASGFETQKTFHFGVPLVRMAPAEQHRLTARVADGVHAALLAAQLLSPSVWRSGHPKIASNRAFILKKMH